MTNETRERIRAYKKLLPDMRERVLGVALLLITSVAMMVTASFAWITLSQAPEVTGMQTTVAANGNLEIALASGTTKTSTAPGESQVGDSSATEGKSLVDANITWGNLINLSDPSYGLDALVLRPAQLNKSSLLISPLYGAEYKGDGRVEVLNSNFGYGSWDAANKIFAISDKLGVRAISSTKVEAVGFDQEVYIKRSNAVKANTTAGSLYLTITTTDAYMNTLATVMGTYMTYSLNDGSEDPTVAAADVQNLRDLFRDFIEVYDAQFQALADLANYQLFLLNTSPTGATQYTEKKAEDMKADTTSESSLKLQNIRINGLDQAKKDYKALQNGYEKLVVLAAQGSVKWSESGFTDIVDSLMDTGKCTIGSNNTPINSIGASNAMQYLSGTQDAKITNGVLFNFEKLNGARCDVRGLEIKAKYLISVTVKANITTSAPQRAQFAADMEDYADGLNQGGVGVQIAKDTYGLALDLWVRTNASGSFLTLEGNVLTKTETVRATGKDIEGNEVELYVLTRQSEVENENGETETVPYTIDLYKVVDGENVAWHDATSYASVTLEDGEEPTAKMVEKVTVIGYEGENRVWEDANAWEQNAQLSLDSTTQGAGSCYVYYADTPEDQARSLKLLDAMNIAFVGADGSLIAEAVMDTERYFAENGRVTVPMKLKSDSSINLGKDSKGDPMYAIMRLPQNEAVRITAIVYLDGTKLTNKDVLAASDIQGQMNIQFGSSVTLSHMEDEKLLGATRSVSATVDKTSFSYDASIENNTPMTTKVTVTVDGDQPKKVEAFFLRKISDTQGSREKSFVLNQQGGTWTYDYTFTAPGVYILRSVQLDGQTYDLNAPFPEITVEGFTVESLDCTEAVGSNVSVMTADASSTVNLKLRFASDDPRAMPTTVQGRYIRKADGVAVNVNFKYNASGTDQGFWTGQATFISSGEYTLEYLVLDGKYAELASTLQQTATVYLGMKVAVYTESPREFLYEGDSMEDNKKNLSMQVKIMDNTGKALEGLSETRLYYRREGSTTNGMDASMTWNGTYYVCTFRSAVGVFRFNYVTVGNNTITFAETAPLFRIISPNPPTYVAHIPEAYKYSENADLDMRVVLKDSETATVAAVIRNLKDNETYEVQGTLTTDVGQVQTLDSQGTSEEPQTWSFRIPANQAGKQDGNWQLETVRVWNFYDADGNFTSAETDEDGKLITDGERDEPLEFYPENHITKAVNTVTATVTVPEGYDHHLGNSALSGAAGTEVTIATATDPFLKTHSVTAPTVTIVDFEGQPIGVTNENGSFISYISNVQMVYNYDGKSSDFGGYTSTAVDTFAADEENITVSLTPDSGYKNFTGAAFSAQYAGGYTPKLKYQVNGRWFEVTAAKMGENPPTFYVWSAKPTATITAISPNSTVNTEITYTAKSLSWGRGTEVTFTVGSSKTNGFNSKDNTATIYAQAVADNSILRSGYFNIPTVTITMGGIPSGSQARLTLPAGEKTAAVTKTCTAEEGKITFDLGSKETIKSWTYYYVTTITLEAYYGHGANTQIKTLTVIKDNAEYTITLDQPIKINNPSSINH